jgi:hypothetical protein
MSIIPIDFQRRFEQRWAARFARQAPEPSSQKSEHEKEDQQLGEPTKEKSNPPPMQNFSGSVTRDEAGPMSAVRRPSYSGFVVRKIPDLTRIASIQLNKRLSFHSHLIPLSSIE